MEHAGTGTSDATSIEESNKKLTSQFLFAATSKIVYCNI
jgi:hypothetical protein